MSLNFASARPRVRPVLATVFIVALLAIGCTGLLQNVGARWVTRQIATEFNLDEAQTEATRASVARLIAAAPGVLGSKVDMLVATADAAIAKGVTETKLLGMERQVDNILDVAVGAILDEAAPILATLRDDQIDFVEARIQKRLDEASEELAEPKQERLEKRQDEFVEAVEDWSGSLADPQEDSLRTYIAGLPDEGATSLAADERRLDAIAAMFREHPGSEAIRDALWTEWKNREDWGPEARSPKARRAEGRQALLFVYELLNVEQRDNASQHLHELHEKVKSFFADPDA